MRVTVFLEPAHLSGDPLQIPVKHYADWLQGAIYQTMGDPIARAVHDNGFSVEKRILRLFAFSHILGRYQYSSGILVFNWPVRVVVSSPVHLIVEQFLQTVLSDREFRLGPTSCRISRVAVEDARVTSPETVVRTLSPITIHSTFTKPEGGTYTQYYHPREIEFGRLIAANLIRKYHAVHGHSWLGSSALVINPVGRTKFHLVRYKNTIIKGYAGTFMVKGPMSLIQVGLDAGLGDRNSQGFGLVEVLPARSSEVNHDYR
ncbi:MAG: CRISPR-associated endoribonuclease Cas6 [Firmicutes bacterium]|nr:CRISPR-associated endoribonuclease Cas6 [Bacillota bacterium]